MQENREQGTETFVIEGRNAVLEAFRSGKTIDKLFLLEGCQDGPIRTIAREARKHSTIVKYVTKERLDQLSETGKHQGVIAQAAAYSYASVDDILQNAKDKGEDPFIILLDGIEDPHNLGAIIRTANLAGAHGVIIPKRRSVSLTGTVAKAAAGALSYVPVARVANIAQTLKALKKEGLWVCGTAMDGQNIYQAPLSGPLAIVIGSEGHGMRSLVAQQCDFTVAIPMKGKINSLNASVACGIVLSEVARRQELGQ